MKPRKHAELIKAWADGAEIQFRAIPNDGDWLDGDENLIWDDWAEYRIKPEPKPDVVKYFMHEFNVVVGSRFTQVFHQGVDRFDLKITWDGETGKLKKAEVP